MGDASSASDPRAGTRWLVLQPVTRHMAHAPSSPTKRPWPPLVAPVSLAGPGPGARADRGAPAPLAALAPAAAGVARRGDGVSDTRVCCFSCQHSHTRHGHLLKRGSHRGVVVRGGHGAKGQGRVSPALRGAAGCSPRSMRRHGCHTVPHACVQTRSREPSRPGRPKGASQSQKSHRPQPGPRAAAWAWALPHGVIRVV